MIGVKYAKYTEFYRRERKSQFFFEQLTNILFLPGQSKDGDNSVSSNNTAARWLHGCD